MSNKSVSRLYYLLVCAGFMLAICAPTIYRFMHAGPEFSAMEKRALNTRPALPRHREELLGFPGKYENYYSDHFGFREFLIRIYRRTKVALGDSPAADVTIGKDGWLFLGSVKPGYSKYSDPIGDARHVNLYTAAELREAAARFLELKQWLAQHGAEYVLVITPNKHTIYSDKLPDYIKQESTYSAADQLVGYLKKNTTITVVDLREELIANKNKGQLYFKTDSHWNSLGANIAQKAIMEVLLRLFPGQIEPQLFAMRQTTTDAKDLAIQLGMEDMVEQDYEAVFDGSCDPSRYPPKGALRDPHTYVCPGRSLNAVVFRDSFFTALQPYFTRQMARATYLWEKPKYELLRDYVEKEKPDLVLEQLLERRLPYIPKKQRELHQPRNKQRFERSQTTLFANNFAQLRYNSDIETASMQGDSLEIVATGENPAIRFPELPMQADTEYILHIQMTSSVDAHLQLLISEGKAKSKTPFSNRRSERLEVRKGENEFYISFSHARMGSLLRVDPIDTPGQVTLHVVQLREAGALL